MASVEEIRRLLDDPNVAPHTKKDLLFDLIAMGGDENDPQALWRYAQQLGVPRDEVMDAVEQVVFDRAPARDVDGHVGQARRDQELGRSWGNLTDGTPSPTSDDILVDGLVGLRIFDEFYPRYQRAGGTGSAVGGRVGSGMSGRQLGVDPDSLRRAADELRGIDFRAFGTDSAAVAEVVSGVDDSRNHLAQAWATNLAGWTGPAAESANAYKARFDGAVAGLDAGIKPVPGALTSASQTIQKQVTDYAKRLHNQWGDGRMARLTPAEVDAVLEGVDKLPGAISSLEGLNSFTGWITGMVGFIAGGPLGAIAAIAGVRFAERLSPWGIDDEIEKARQALRTCQEKVEQFKQDYEARASSVHDYTEQACQAVQQSYDALFAATTGQGKLSANPFDAVGATPDFEDAGQNGGGRRDTGGGPGPSGGRGPGGGPGPSSPVPDAGGYTPPPVPDGTDPALAGPGATDPALAGGGAPPPGSTVPGADPGGAGVPPVPDGGGVGPGNGSAPGKSVTIKDGNRTITVGQPDARGRSKLTVDDGTGKPKDYDLDFDENGKAVIQDGDATITTERDPADPNRLKMTVDDGTPPPGSYTLDFDPTAAGSPGGVPGIPVGTGGAAELGGGGGIGGGGGGGVGVPTGAGVAAGSGGATPALEFGGATGAQSPGAPEERAPAATVAAGAGGGPGGTQGGAMGGMPMGGIGGGQGGGDQTRTSKWRTQGQLFDEEDPAANFSGVIGEDPNNRAGKTKKG